MKLFESSVSATRPQREVQLTAINFVADAVNRANDPKEISENALHAIVTITKVDAGAVYIWQESDQALRLVASRGLSEAFARQVVSIRRGDDTTVDAVLEGNPRIIDDFKLTPHIFRVDVLRAGFGSAMMCPIRAQGFVIGLLALGMYKPRSFNAQDVQLIDVISNQVGNALVHTQLQSDLRASEEQYRSLVENSDDAIYIAGPDGRPRFGNPAFKTIFGYDAQELSEIDPFQRIHPDDIDGFRQAIATLAQGQLVQNLEYRFCRKDGEWLDLQCTGSVFALDGQRPEEFQFVVREVTQQKQREKELLRRNQQLAALTTLAAVANSSLNIEEIARNTLTVALESTGMDGGGIHLADPERRQIRLFVQIGLPDELAKDLRSLNWGEGVAGEAASAGQVRVFSDLATQAANARPAALKHGFKSLIVVPVKAKGEVLGTLGLTSKHEMQFTSDAIEMVTAMGNQLGIAVANARLYELQLRENEKLNTLLDITGGGSQLLDLDPLLQRILNRSVTLLQADASYIIRYEKHQAEIVAATANFEKFIGATYPADEGLSGQIRTSRQGKIFSGDEAERHGYSPVWGNADSRSVLLVPLISRNELIGALGLTRNASSSSDFTVADLRLMEAFASRAATAIDNAQLLKDLSRKNELLELLIEEAHHRIKNNLQMISGLLQLEAEATAGASTERLRQAIARIQAIGQVHNLLSQEMPEKVDAHTLITTIVDTLISSAPRSDGEPELQLELQHVWLNADQAVALALVVNELVANSLLHGAPVNGERLRVHVQCELHDHEVCLTTTDNGGGMRDSERRQSTGQGMHIVAQLAQVNLRGHLEIATRDGGVCASLRFSSGNGATLVQTKTAKTN